MMKLELNEMVKIAYNYAVKQEWEIVGFTVGLKGSIVTAIKQNGSFVKVNVYLQQRDRSIKMHEKYMIMKLINEKGDTERIKKSEW